MLMLGSMSNADTMDRPSNRSGWLPDLQARAENVAQPGLPPGDTKHNVCGSFSGCNMWAHNIRFCLMCTTGVCSQEGPYTFIAASSTTDDRTAAIGRGPHLAQLHEHIDNAQEVARAEGVADVRGGHVVLVQRALALGQAALDDVLVLAGQLLLHIPLQPPQQEGPQHAVQPLHKSLHSVERN